jgi:hypothetical protein
MLISGFWKSGATAINCILYGFGFSPDFQITEFGTIYFFPGEEYKVANSRYA